MNNQPPESVFHEDGYKIGDYTLHLKPSSLFEVYILSLRVGSEVKYEYDDFYEVTKKHYNVSDITKDAVRFAKELLSFADSHKGK